MIRLKKKKKKGLKEMIGGTWDRAKENDGDKWMRWYRERKGPKCVLLLSLISVSLLMCIGSPKKGFKIWGSLSLFSLLFLSLVEYIYIYTHINNIKNKIGT